MDGELCSGGGALGLTASAMCAGPTVGLWWRAALYCCTPFTWDEILTIGAPRPGPGGAEQGDRKSSGAGRRQEEPSLHRRRHP